MRILVLFLALAVVGWATGTDEPQNVNSAAQSSQTPPGTPPSPEVSKPADAPAPSAPAKLNGWVVSGLADGYFTLNFNHPASNANQLQNFDLNWGQPEISEVLLTIDKSDKVFGVHLETGFGETMRLIHAGDPAAREHQALRYVKQMYVIAKPNHTHGSEFDFGEFVTSAGAEVIESSSNWNYTRSLLFSWAIPYYHFGFRSNIPVTKELAVGFQLVNAWNTLWGNNNLDNIGLTLAYTKPKFTYNLNYYEGPNHMGTREGKRNLVDSTLTLTPTSKLAVYINGDYGRDDRIGGGYDPWYGLAGAARVQLSKRFAVAGRAEFFDDVTGFTTGTKQILKEGTVTGEYKYNDHLVGRLEFRRDVSNVAFFDRGAQAGRSRDMDTATIGIVALLGPMK